MKIIKRKQYLNQLIRLKGTPDIKVITGVRRSGKSKLLESFRDYLLRNDAHANIIFINLQDIENENLLEYHALHSYVLEKYDVTKNNYLFIDEVQLCDGFEKAINSLHSKGLFDIYVTGSNAFLLSSDLATLFTGRTFSIEVFPFSFQEFLEYFQLDNIDQAFDQFFFDGGFAGSYGYSSLEEKYSYIERDVYEAIVIRDLMKKYNIKNRLVLENLCSYMIDNISNLISPNNITNYLKSKNYKITDKTIHNYMRYLCNAFVFYQVNRYDLKGKRYLSTESKYYLCDPVIKYARLGVKNIDRGRTYENIVAMELLRRGYRIYVGKLYQKEVDFVAVKRNEQIYIQVCRNIDDEETFQREVSPLLAIRDAYPKIIITRTKEDAYTYEGIQIIDIARWLLH